jgi:hypothetical protein
VTLNADSSPRDFYADAVMRLTREHTPFLVGGAFALERYTQIARDTKDLDIFMREADVPRALEMFARAGYFTELPFPHWLGKVHYGLHFIDIIFSSGNGVARVDEAWFSYAAEEEMFGIKLRLCPPEEMIWSKGYIQERERFDGADVMHLLRARARSLDWNRLLMRFGAHWRVLLGHIVLFGFVYPDRRDDIPSWVVQELTRLLAAERSDATSDVCNGLLVSREQYLYDLAHFGYRDPRIEPEGGMSSAEAAIWTAAITDFK